MRSLFVRSLLFALCLAVAAAAQQKPNVIFILTDDMGYGDMGCAGHPYVKTPNIDRLAREGTMFTDFYVNSGVCAPSRTAFMTGMFPARNNVHHIYHTPDHNREKGVPDFLDPDLLTVADVMKQAGYTTGHIGKWHLCGQFGPTPDRYGFDSGLISHDGNASPLYRERWKTTEHQVTASSHWIMEDGIDFIQKHKDDGKPFFLNLWTLVPHALLKPSPEELAVYEGLQVDADDFPSWMKDYVKESRDPDSQMKVYCASMTSLDAAIGKLLEALDEAGLSENTLILLSSDNGPEDYNCGNAANAGVGSPGQFRGRKRSPYLGGMRVPMLVRWPGKTPAGVKNDAVWSAVDFLPTFASLVGVELPPELDIDGEDLSPILTGGKNGRTKPLFWEWKYEIFGNQDYRSPQVCMLDGKWWAGWSPDGSRVELYDVKADPAQRINLKDQQPETAARLVKELAAWKKTIPESAYEQTAAVMSPEGGAVVLSAVKRVGYEPATGIVKNDEQSGGTGVFGCAGTRRDVYLWFEIPKENQAQLKSLNSWEMELVISTRSGTKAEPKPADELRIDFMGSFDAVNVDAGSLAVYSTATPVQSFVPDYQDVFLAGRYTMALRGFTGDRVGAGRYLLFRLSDASPVTMHWSSCNLRSSLVAK